MNIINYEPNRLFCNTSSPYCSAKVFYSHQISNSSTFLGGQRRLNLKISSIENCGYFFLKRNLFFQKNIFIQCMVRILLHNMKNIL